MFSIFDASEASFSKDKFLSFSLFITDLDGEKPPTLAFITASLTAFRVQNPTRFPSFDAGPPETIFDPKPVLAITKASVIVPVASSLEYLLRMSKSLRAAVLASVEVMNMLARQLLVGFPSMIIMILIVPRIS